MNIKSKVLHEKVPELFNLSVSKTKTFSGCKLKYKFSYIEKLPKKDWEHQIFGKFIHEILENFHKTLLDGCKEPYNIIMTRLFKESLVTWKLSPESKKEGFQVIVNYLVYLAKETKTGLTPTVLALEKDFYISIDNKILLIGFIDKVQIDTDGVLHVLDYKTSAKPDYLKKDWMQLLTYAYALWLEDQTITKIRGSYVMMKLKKLDPFGKPVEPTEILEVQTITRDFSIDEIVEMENVFLDYALKINAEQKFEPTVSPLCAYCDYLALCPPGEKFVKDKKEKQKRWAINTDMSFGASNW